jgi:hypothetical protein
LSISSKKIIQDSFLSSINENIAHNVSIGSPSPHISSDLRIYILRSISVANSFAAKPFQELGHPNKSKVFGNDNP